MNAWLCMSGCLVKRETWRRRKNHSFTFFFISSSSSSRSLSVCFCAYTISLSLDLASLHSLSHSVVSSRPLSPISITAKPPHSSIFSPCNLHFLRRHLWHVLQKINLIGQSACQSIFPAREGERARLRLSLQTGAGRPSRLPSFPPTQLPSQQKPCRRSKESYNSSGLCSAHFGGKLRTPTVLI